MEGGDASRSGTNTDPYQWVEGRYKLMRGIWEALRDFRNPCSILTKSPLLLRDLDLLKEIAAVTEVSACLSVPTLDEKAWRATEPHTPQPEGAAGGGGRAQPQRHPDRRADRAADARRSTTRPSRCERIVEVATEANATYIGGQTLFLRGAGARHLLRLAARAPAGPGRRATSACTPRARYLSAGRARKIELAAGAPWALRTYPTATATAAGRRRRPRRAPPRRTVQESLF